MAKVSLTYGGPSHEFTDVVTGLKWVRGQAHVVSDDVAERLVITAPAHKWERLLIPEPVPVPAPAPTPVKPVTSRRKKRAPKKAGG